MSRKPKPPGPTVRMRAFVREFCVCHNGAEAARKAGYSAQGAKEIAYRLLQRDDIAAAIRKREEGDERLVGSRKHYIVNSLVQVVEESRQAKPVRDPKGKKLGLLKYDGPTAVRALELLGKHEGLFRDQIDVRVQGALEDLLEGVRALMSPQAYAELIAAVAEISGVPRMGAPADAGSGTDAVH